MPIEYPHRENKPDVCVCADTKLPEIVLCPMHLIQADSSYVLHLHFIHLADASNSLTTRPQQTRSSNSSAQTQAKNF